MFGAFDDGDVERVQLKREPGRDHRVPFRVFFASTIATPVFHMTASGTTSLHDHLLFGVDPTPGIVGIHRLPSRSSQETPRMRVYRRRSPLDAVESVRAIDAVDGADASDAGDASDAVYASDAGDAGDAGDAVDAVDVEFYPFFLLSDIRLLQGFPRQEFRFQRLEGPGHYRFLIAFGHWRSYWNALRHLDRAADTRQAREHYAYVLTSPEQQYLIQTGRTLFKNMTFDDLHRLQLDIETYTEQEFSNARRSADRILLIAMRDSRGWSRVVDGREADEAEMIREMVRIIRERDPDVIEGHNILGFDFPYLLERARRCGVEMGIGRDGSPPRSFSTSIRFAERTVDYTAVNVAGRHIIDTYLLVLGFDVVKRDMPGYGLKAAARYFGVAAENRTYVEGSNISHLWRTDPDRLVRYALDDVTETDGLARRLSGSAFYLTQIVPMPFGQAARTGPAAKIESLFVRQYLRKRAALPRAGHGSQTVGGYTDVFLTGIAGPIVYADVESLYPSIMLHYDVGPGSDHLKLFPDLLHRLTRLRLDTKETMRATEDEAARAELDARQSSYKILINSFYGMLGFSRALFNDFSEADRVAQIGQNILRSIIRDIADAGGRVIEVDTDGVFFVPPAYALGRDAEAQFIKRLNTNMPAGIHIAFEGRYQKMLSYKMKNYALLGYDGKLSFKGSSLISRSNERFGRRFVRESIKRLLDEDVTGLHQLYLRTRDRIIRHEWESVSEFSRTETIKESVDQYRYQVERGRRPKAASYELAIRRAQRTGRRVRKGDRVTYYVTGQSPDVTAFENCRSADDWDPANPDENTAYYLRRLDDFALKFEPFFKPNEFRLIFSPEDLFGFSAEGIHVLVHERPVDLSTPAGKPT